MISHDIDDMELRIKLIRAKLKRIADETRRKRHDEIGNQNCLLCTVCFEMSMRGKDVLPRPVYSPRDPIFNHVDEPIVTSGTKIRFNSIDDAETIVKDAGDGSRFYIHVNWKGSASGHEFMLLNLKGNAWLADPQIGKLLSFDSKGVERYFNINPENSFLVRTDTSEVKPELLKLNNKRYLVEWDEDKDVKYMREHDMLDEAADSQLLSKPNLELNVDAFYEGEDNVLLITGISGGGKSTLAKLLAEEHDAEIINLDIIQRYYIDGPEAVHAWNEEKFQRHGIQVHEFDNEFYQTHPRIPWGKIPKEEAWAKTDYIPWLIDRCRMEKGRRFIIEGSSIAYMDPMKLAGVPLIIVGTGALKAQWRRNLRLTKNRSNLGEWIDSVVKAGQKMTHVRNMALMSEPTARFRRAVEDSIDEGATEVVPFDPKYKPKERWKLDRFKRRMLTTKDMETYKDIPMIERLKDAPSGAKLVGYFDGTNLVACYGVRDREGAKRFWGFEVTPDYRGHGLSEPILRDAIDRYGVNDLWVADDNRIAQSLYHRMGFNDAEITEDKQWMRMLRPSVANESVRHVDFDFPNHTWKTGELKSHDVSEIRDDADKRGVLDRGPVNIPGEESNLDGDATYKTMPSDVVDYYSETALKAKTRNALPDEAFGLPRLRAYPIHDANHVKQAVRMFNHCKDPNDRKVLASRIFSAASKFKVDVKVGKGNALYDYAPEAFRESAENEAPTVAIGVSGKTFTKRTREDVIKEHLSQNSILYNGVIYNPEFAKAIQGLEPNSFLQYFYPRFGRLDLHARLNSMVGGMASRENASMIYGFLKIDDPYTAYSEKPRILGHANIGNDEDAQDEFASYVSTCYSTEANWFKVDLHEDIDHIYYCLRLYSIINAIVNNPYFAQATCLDNIHLRFLFDWGSRVWYHYDLYTQAVRDHRRKEALVQTQYLYDLIWPISLNPYDSNDVATCIIDFTSRMASTPEGSMTLSEGGEMLSREQVTSYLVNDLGIPDDCFLIQSKSMYPVLDRTSVMVAMNNIGYVDEDDIKEYTTNLNRKYRELGCRFSISVDHPYAKYADKNIIDNMTHVLLEGDNGVDDQGTSSSAPLDSERSTYKPWYTRSDISHGMEINMLDNREMGPNLKKQQVPEFTPHESIL